MSKFIFVNLPTQELQIITEAFASVASVDQNILNEQAHFFSTSGRLWARLSTNVTTRRSDTLRKQ